MPDPIPSPEQRSPYDCLTLLHSILKLDGPFHQQLLTSFNEAQSSLLLRQIDQGKSLPLVKQQVFAYDADSPSNKQLMNELFREKLEMVRGERPVVEFNLLTIAQEKMQAGESSELNIYDLLYTLSQALTDRKTAKQDSNGLFPILTAHYVPKEARKLLKKVEFNSSKEPLPVELAFIWGETAQTGKEFDSFNSLMLKIADSNYQLTTSIFLPQSIINTSHQSYGSPWGEKLVRDQLIELNTEKITRTLDNALIAANPYDENRIRIIVRPFGSGKTKMLAELQTRLIKEGIFDITFINGSEGIDTQEEALRGNVIFVDEAANIDMQALAAQTNQSILILFYPSLEAVKQKMPDTQWPESSYTLVG